METADDAGEVIAVGVDGFIREVVGGPDQVNFGSEEKTEASIKDET